jgi:hypothetical protein
MSSLYDSFKDDKKLRKAIKWHLESSNVGQGYLGTMSLVSGTQACSNFRPAFARYLYERYAPEGATVFDSSTGYGGRLTGFLASHCKQYIGVDPNVPTFKANLELARCLGAHKVVRLFNEAIEDFDAEPFKEHCDFAFTSPPYFVKEQYSADSTQSCVRYPDYMSWLEGFLRPMLLRQYLVLKAGCLNIVNIEDVTVHNETYGLVDPTIEIAKQIGFEFVSQEKFPLQSRTKLKDGKKVVEDADESVLIFKKQS